jgi:hypothetical protein
VHGQLQAIVEELDAARARLRALNGWIPPSAWAQRPAPTRWSPAECVAHLNLSSEALLPLLHAGLRQARRCRPGITLRYRRDALGWLMWRVVSPSSRLRATTPKAFDPGPRAHVTGLLTDFDRLQAALAACVCEADGLGIDEVRIASPFDARMTYNLYAALTLVPRHQHRHLRQAERAARACATLASAVAM